MSASAVAPVAFDDLRAQLEQTLRQGCVKAPRHEADFILRHVLGLGPVAPKPGVVSAPDASACEAWARASVETRCPATVRAGYCWFHGQRVGLAPGVMVPDLASELLVQVALELLSARAAPRVADIGTGAGCVALALGHARSDARVWASDISAAAVRLANANVTAHGLDARVQVCLGDGLAALPPYERFDLIVSNPPYMPASARAYLPPEVLDHSPPEAVFAGEDGLDIYRGLLAQANEHLRGGGAVALEFGDEVRAGLLALAAQTRSLRVTDVVEHGSERTWGAVLVLRARA